MLPDTKSFCHYSLQKVLKLANYPSFCLNFFVIKKRKREYPVKYKVYTMNYSSYFIKYELISSNGSLIII